MTNRDAFIARWQYLIDEYHNNPVGGIEGLEAAYEAKSKEFADSVDQLVRESINEFTHGGYPELMPTTERIEQACWTCGGSGDTNDQVNSGLVCPDCAGTGRA